MIGRLLMILVLATSLPARAADQAAWLVVAADGTVLEAQDPDRALAAASVTKLLTGWAALNTLGHNHRFTTDLVTAGSVNDGVLDGDLWLVGGGDPFLTTDDFANLIADAGLRRVTGGFFYDVSALPELPAIDPGQPADTDYNPGIGALSVNFNRVRVRWRPEGADAASIADGGAVAAPWLPLTRTDRRNGTVQRFFPDSTGGWLLGGDLPPRGTTWLPVPDPGAHGARLFRAVAQGQGLSLPPPRPGPAPADGRVLARHASPPLADIVAGVLNYSNNLSAELIGLATVRALAGPMTNLAGAAGHLARWLVPVTGTAARLANFSGLSGGTRLSPRQIIGILMTWPDPALLPAKGTRYGLAANAVRAKSGTLYFARALAGRLITASGRPIWFALILNDGPRRTALDRAGPAGHTPATVAAAGAWRGRALAREAELIRHWHRSY